MSSLSVYFPFDLEDLNHAQYDIPIYDRMRDDTRWQ